MHSQLTMSRRQRGMSLVELMVGVTVGLFIVAAAVTLVAGQLADNRKLTRELQVQQDLRATGDIITRQLRRAGYAGVFDAQNGITTPDGATAQPNPKGGVTTSAGFEQVDFRYFYNPADVHAYGYRLEGGMIRARLSGSDAWQPLTDPNSVTITDFAVTPGPGLRTRMPCLAPCPAPSEGTSTCWPELVVREYDIFIRGHAVGDPQTVREIRSRVRLRNDWVQFQPNGSAPQQACPAG